MDTWIDNAARVALIGIFATAFMDAWLLLLKRLGVPTLNFGFIGRWVGHWRYGRWTHAEIARTPPIQGEQALGWLVHYTTGVAFATLLVLLQGADWLDAPTLAGGVLTGLVTVAAPWLVMQPAMGAGIAASKTPAPTKNRLRSLANHAVFGLGLYLAAVLLARISR
jgi:hypothetical protein